MDGHIIVAVQIDWTGGLVQVTDTTLRIDAALLEDGQFEPRLLGGVSWGESARHPYQQQAGELSIGNLTLANSDGGLDALATGDVVGAEVELRRGSDADRWADLEFVFVARVSGVRLNGRSEIVLELENVLAALAGPVFSDKFADTVPNPQLEGKDIPLVLGRVKQAPVLEFNPATLTYYTATNTSKIGQVAEGGNPTQRWTLEDQPTFNLLGSPSLAITADFEGPGEQFSDFFAAIATESTWPNITLGNTSLGPQSYVAGTGSVDVTVSRVPLTPTNAVAGGAFSSTARLTNAEQVAWTIGASDATIAISDQRVVPEYLDFTIAGLTNITYGQRCLISIDVEHISGDVIIDGAYLLVNTFFGQQEIFISYGQSVGSNRTIVLDLPVDKLNTFLNDFWPFGPQVIGVRIEASNTNTGSVKVTSVSADLFPSIYEGVRLDRDAVNVTDTVALEIDHSASTDGVGVAIGFDFNASFLNIRPAFPLEGQTAVLDASGGTFTASFNVGQLLTGGNSSLVVVFYTNESISSATTVTKTITDFRLFFQNGGELSYKTLAPYILTTADIDPALHLDQTAINAHADSFGNPDLGWLVRGDETVDQILFRLAGSLGGYVWHGLDGRVRSKRLELPADPGIPTFVIDSSRVWLDDITAYDDPAPQLTTRVNALRNWQPIPPDRQAGITSTWTESDRAGAAADWRITRVYAADADYKRRWAAVESREPYSSALLTGTDAQTLADQAGLWANRPRFYEIPTEVLIGELSQVAVGEIVRVEVDYPGLDGRWMLVLGREGDARPGTVNLTLWG